MASVGCHGAQERSVPAKNGCCPNAPDGGHSTQAGARLDITPVALPEPPEPVRPDELDPPLLGEVAPTALPEKEDPAGPAPELDPLPEPATVVAGEDCTKLVGAP
jgi:hypothetical protein